MVDPRLPKKLPTCLEEIESFSRLNEELRHQLLIRILRIEGVCQNIKKELDHDQIDEIGLFMDSELDALSILSSPSGQPEISRFVTHQSWLQAFDRAVLFESVAPILLEKLEKPAPSLSSSADEMLHWIADHADSLLTAITGFFLANKAAVAASNVLVIDIFVAQLAAVSMGSRLNVNFKN